MVKPRQADPAHPRVAARGVDDVIEVGPGLGTSSSPDYPDGAVTPGWAEVEWRNFGHQEPGSYYFGGVWFGGPGTAKIGTIPFDEFVYLRRGSVRFTDRSGAARDFHEGSAFLIPKGFSGQWELATETEIVYVGLGPFDSAMTGSSTFADLRRTEPDSSGPVEPRHS